MKVQTKLGSSPCGFLNGSATDTLNDNPVNELTIGAPGAGVFCSTSNAMPFTTAMVANMGTFPINRGFGKIVLKQKGKSTTEGIAELVPDPSVSDLLAFSTTEGSPSRDCSYVVSKKLKGTWHGGTEMTIEFDSKWKLSGSNNETACPKTITTLFEYELEDGSEFVELAPV